ncbi:MAG: fluoride efflux transporter CrcB [Mailhella sp.]|nr:fluoride efflux transporter CrcB [Mailhella sp.]
MNRNILLSLPVLLGGALGALCRVHGNSAVMAAMGGHFPLGILCVNMAGSFVMGLLMGLLSRMGQGCPAGPWLNAFLGTGFLGGFTTFSSFALDTVRLWQGGHMNFALLNIGLNAALCVALAGLGWLMASPHEEDA